MTEKLLRLDKLATKYVGGDFSLVDIEFDLKEEELLFVYGREGSGKTLLLRTVAGLELPLSGSIYLGEDNIKDIALKDREIGFTFDCRSLNDKECVEEVISFPMKLREYSHDEIFERVSEVCKIFDLERSKKVLELTDYEKSRLLLARLFAAKRKLYIVDDVWKDLSQDDKKAIYSMLAKAVESKSVIVATDDKEFVNSCGYEAVVTLFDGSCSEKLSLEQMALRPPNIECAILCGYEIYMDVLGKDVDGYYVVIDGDKYSVKEPLSDIYVGKEVCFALLDDNCACYYDKDCERIISR